MTLILLLSLNLLWMIPILLLRRLLACPDKQYSSPITILDRSRLRIIRILFATSNTTSPDSVLLFKL